MSFVCYPCSMTGLRLWALLSLAIPVQAEFRWSTLKSARSDVQLHRAPTALAEVAADGSLNSSSETADSIKDILQEAILVAKLEDKLEAQSLQKGLSAPALIAEAKALLRRELRSVQPTVAGKHKVGVVIMADKTFQERYKAQIQSVKCFVQNQGYDLFLLQGKEFAKCDRFQGSSDKYFYLKHCAVAELLAQQAPKYVLAVLDADVAAIVMDRSLSQWTDSKGDLQFYERIAGDEVMAGNYIAKNVPWVRQFLHTWADMLDVKPPGFSSCDNGALHLMLVKALELDGSSDVEVLYNNLTAKVDNLDPYWNFVRTSKKVLGPPRAWNMNRTKMGRDNGCGSPLGDSCILTVWPRMNFFVDDGAYLNFHANHAIGPVMHHGIKQPDDVSSFYFKDLWKCKTNEEKVILTADAFGHEVLNVAEGYTQFYQRGTCRQCVERCAANFTCPPLEDDETAPVLVQQVQDGKPGDQGSPERKTSPANKSVSPQTFLEVESYESYMGRLPPRPVIWHRMMEHQTSFINP